MYKEINKLHFDAHLGCANLTGGQQRAKRGKLVETMIEAIWTSLGGTFTSDKFLTQRGDTEIKMALDRNLYKGDKLVAMVECKSYLDLCYLERAEWNARELSEGAGIQAPKFILALQDSVNATSMGYVLAGKHIEDIFFLVDRKRSSTKPLYKQEFYEDIDEGLFDKFYTYFHSLYQNS